MDNLTVFCTGHLLDGTRFYGELTNKQFLGYSGDERFDVTIDSDHGSTGVMVTDITVSQVRDIQKSTPTMEHHIFLLEGKMRAWGCNATTI